MWRSVWISREAYFPGWEGCCSWCSARCQQWALWSQQFRLWAGSSVFLFWISCFMLSSGSLVWWQKWMRATGPWAHEVKETTFRCYKVYMIGFFLFSALWVTVKAFASYDLIVSIPSQFKYYLFTWLIAFNGGDAWRWDCILVLLAVPNTCL